MTTLNEISYLIAGRLNKTTDYVIINEIAQLVIGWRATLIRQDVQKNMINAQYAQSIVLPLVNVDSIDNSLISSYVAIKKTVNKIPTSIRLDIDSPYLFVGEPTFNKGFGFIQQMQVGFIKNRKFSRNNVYYTIRNQYLYLYYSCELNLEYVGIQSIFENPRELAELDVNACCIDYMEQAFYLPLDMQNTIVTEIVKILDNTINSKNEVKIDG